MSFLRGEGPIGFTWGEWLVVYVFLSAVAYAFRQGSSRSRQEERDRSAQADRELWSGSDPEKLAEWDRTVKPRRQARERVRMRRERWENLAIACLVITPAILFWLLAIHEWSAG